MMFIVDYILFERFKVICLEKWYDLFNKMIYFQLHSFNIWIKLFIEIKFNFMEKLLALVEFQNEEESNNESN